MELNKDVYQALEDIVGPEYITQEPAIRDTYNQVWGNKLVYDEKWSIRPAAVLLPANTAEVQAVIKACNRYKVVFKAFSSGFEIVATSLEDEKSIILDLRRMNRILDIDTKNMHAVVEPFVSVHRLQIEAAKHGLYTGSIGAGPSAGVIAAAIAHFGSGQTMNSTGGLGRNVLGCEWVLPTGDIVRLGTAGSGDGWFSADGPGLSLRGILRGHAGANGGNGVFTKASVKLYPWYGPSEWEYEREVGVAPIHRHLAKPLDGHKTFFFTLPSEAAMFDALVEIGKAEVACSVMGCLVFKETEGNDEAWALMQAHPEMPEMLERSLIVVLATNSSREMEYREKIVNRLIDKFGGVLIPPFNDPSILTGVLENVLWSYDYVMFCFRGTADFLVVPTSDGTEAMIKQQNKVSREMQASYKKKGLILDPGLHEKYNLATENYSVGSHYESGPFYDPWNPESLAAAKQCIAELLDPNGRNGVFEIPCLGGGLQIESHSHVHQTWGPHFDNYDSWLQKVKRMLDPNNVCDWSAYIPPVFP